MTNKNAYAQSGVDVEAGYEVVERIKYQDSLHAQPQGLERREAVPDLQGQKGTFGVHVDHCKSQ